MQSGVAAAEAVLKCTADLRAEKLESAYQKPFLQKYGAFFRQMADLQTAYFKNDGSREALIHILDDPEIQNLTLQSFLFKKMISLPLKLKAKSSFHLLKARLGNYNVKNHTEQKALIVK